MFCVYDNNRPASVHGFPHMTAWRTYRFNTFDEACAYANKWLGKFALDKYTVDIPQDYSRYGDLIVIKQEPELSKVYVLTQYGDDGYKDYCIIGIFTSLEKLNKYIQNHPDKEYNDPEIYPLNEVFTGVAWIEWFSVNGK